MYMAEILTIMGQCVEYRFDLSEIKVKVILSPDIGISTFYVYSVSFETFWLLDYIYRETVGSLTT